MSLFINSKFENKENLIRIKTVIEYFIIIAIVYYIFAYRYIDLGVLKENFLRPRTHTTRIPPCAHTFGTPHARALEPRQPATYTFGGFISADPGSRFAPSSRGSTRTKTARCRSPSSLSTTRTFPSCYSPLSSWGPPRRSLSQMSHNLFLGRHGQEPEPGSSWNLTRSRGLRRCKFLRPFSDMPSERGRLLARDPHLEHVHPIDFLQPHLLARHLILDV